MSDIGSAANPLKVAIVGSGPAGFYTVSNLLKHRDLNIHMDMFEKLPTPFGLVRAGVAPDHQKEKSVVRAYEKSAADVAFRYFGNVEFGKHVLLDDLRAHYHQIVFATGAQSDRVLNIPGEEAPGSYAATDFVAWYNGHPDFAEHTFNFNATSVAVVGLGNVAVDVARILCKTSTELQRTDIADYALAALDACRVREVIILGRRGPAQAAFTTPELKEMGELADTDIDVWAGEAALDELSRETLLAAPDKTAEKNLQLLNEYAQWQVGDKEKRLTIRFLVSPVEIVTGADGHVSGVRVVKNKLFKDDKGDIRVKPADASQEETIPVQMIFRSVGYRGVVVPGVPFDADKGVVPNVAGRVVDDKGGHVPGVYVAGWIKRGPTGVIGSNKTDAKETVACMVDDLREGRVTADMSGVDRQAIAELLRARQARVVTYTDWRELDEIEVSKGVQAERPRVKFTSVADMLSVLER